MVEFSKSKKNFSEKFFQIFFCSNLTVAVWARNSADQEEAETLPPQSVLTRLLFLFLHLETNYLVVMQCVQIVSASLFSEKRFSQKNG